MKISAKKIIFDAIKIINIDIYENDSPEIVSMKVDNALNNKQFIEGEFEEVKEVKLLK